MGGFFGFKLHIVINDLDHMIAFKLTPGNKEDRAVIEDLTAGMLGKLFADKGYISQDLFESLLERNLQLITAVRSNMKPQITEQENAKALNKSSLIESVFNVLKNSCRIEHSSPGSCIASRRSLKNSFKLLR